jgi:hypothetical protein
MGTATRVGRLSALAVGLGMPEAVASRSGSASADDFRISIDGLDFTSAVGNDSFAMQGRRHPDESKP